MSQTTETASSESFEGFAIVELFGRNVVAGYCTQQLIAGVAMLRVDVPAVEGRASYSKFFSGGSIYAITPTDEETAKTAASRLRSRPIDLWIVPETKALPSPSDQPRHLPDDDYSNSREDWYDDGADEEFDEEFDEGDFPSPRRSAV